MAEDLKKSKNVRLHTRNLAPGVATQRMLDYLRRVGFRPRAGNQDRFGVGKDQRELIYSHSGAPAHEAGHALMTPIGQDLRGRQKTIGQVTSTKGITPDEAWADENAAFAMQPKLARRAGLGGDDGDPYAYHARSQEIGGPPGTTPKTRAAAYSQGQKDAGRELSAFEEGRKVIGPKGQVQQGTSVDAKINTRAMRKDETGFPKWRDQYPMVDAEHSHHLETAAAIQEFMHKVPRHQAEAAAHEEYRKDQLAEAAAHHLVGMKAAHAAGALEDAKKHGVLYALAAKQLGFDPAGEPPSDITTKEKNLSATKPVYKFKSHKGDAFALPQLPPAEQQVQKSELRKADIPRIDQLGEYQAEGGEQCGWCGKELEPGSIFVSTGRGPHDWCSAEHALKGHHPQSKWSQFQRSNIAEMIVGKAEPPGRLPADTQAAISADPAAVKRATLRPAFHNPSTGEVHAMDSAWHNTDELAEKTGNPQGWDPDPEEWVAGFSDHRGQFYDRYQAARKVQGRSIEPDDYEDCPDHLESLNYYQGVKDGYYKSESSLEKAAPPPITGEYGHHLPQKLRAAGYSLTVEHAGTEFVNNRYVPQARALLYVKGKPILSASTRPDGGGLDYHELDLKSREWKPSAGVAFPGLEQGFHGALAEHLGPHAAEAGLGIPPMPYLRKDDVLQLPGAAATPPVQPDRKAGGMKVASLLGHKRKVAAQAREAAQTAPLPSGTPDELLEQGTDLHDAGDVHNAARFYRSAINANPNMFEAHLNLGQLLHDSGDPMAAYSHYETAGRLKPSDPTVHFNLGVAQEDMGHTQDAINHYRAALQLDPAMADAHFNIARLHEQIGDTQSAIRHLNEHRRLSSGKSPSAPPAETSPKGFVQSVREWPQDGPTTVRNSSLAPANDNSVIKPSAPPTEGKVIPFQRSEPLAKRSKNVREILNSISPAQAARRRTNYARSIGLDPYRRPTPADHPGLDDQGPDFPPVQENRIFTDPSFPVQHETAHAMMTPAGETIEEHNQHIDRGMRDDPEDQVYDEHVTSQMEPRIDRRAGVPPQSTRYSPIPPTGVAQKLGLPMDSNAYGNHLRQAARNQVEPYDRGDYIAQDGTRVSNANSLDNRINSRQLGVDWLRGVRARMTKSEPLMKRSKNVREQISKITPRQAEQRRVKYAQSIGLKPVKDRGYPDLNPGKNVFKPEPRFPQANRNKLGYGDSFQVEHETAHAMMTPQGQTIRQYQNHLSAHADPRKVDADDEYDDGRPDDDHYQAQHDEVVANQLENLIDRRAGVSPSKFRSEFRTAINGPKDMEEMPEDWVDDEASRRAYRSGQRGAGPTTGFELPDPGIRQDAQSTARDFDEGARFNQYGKIVNSGYGDGPHSLKPNQTLDQKINRRMLGVEWLRDFRDRTRIAAENARMNGGGGPYLGWNKGR